VAWPNPVPLDARNCILYGFIRSATGAGVLGVQVLVGPPEIRTEVGFTTETGQTFGEGTLDYESEVFTDSAGYWQIEVRQGLSYRVRIPRLKMDTTAQVPAAVRQDFTYWAYQPVISDSRKFIADPVNAPTAIDTSLLVRVDADLQDFVLKLWDKIKIWECATRNGTYVETTTALTRIELVDGRTFYEFFMAGVAAGKWYRASYFNSTRAIDGPLGPPIKNDPPDYTIVLTVDELKEYYLFGVNLTDDLGKPYSRDMYEGYIRDAIGWMERELDVSLKPKAQVESQDFNIRDYDEWCFVQLNHLPILAVDSIEFRLGNQSIFAVPNDWVHIDLRSGQLQLLPTSGSLGTAMMSTPGTFGSMMMRMFSRVPDYIRVTYRHGFAIQAIPPEIKNLVAYRASFGPLNIAGDLLGGAGIASASLSQDGISQSYSTTSSATNAGYGARLIQYTKEIKERMPGLKRYYQGIRAVVG
jgi:hypothetical protein